MENNKAEAAEKPRRIWGELDQQQRSIELLIESIDVLNVRLNSIMSDPTPKTEETEDAPPKSTMATRVSDHTSQIDVAARRLRDIDERLEV